MAMTASMPLITTAPMPLSTIFSLPYTLSTSCFSQMYWDGTAAVVLGPGYQCIPTGPSAVSHTLSTYYSPGLWDGRPACPDNWTPACSETITSSTITETAVICCPNGNGLGPLSFISFTCQPSASLSVASQFNYYGCTMQLGALATLVSLTVTNTYGSSPVSSLLWVQPDQGLNAFSVQLRWQETDLHRAVRTASSSSPTSFSTPSPQLESEDGGLSSGAKIAIAVSIPTVVIAATMIVLFIYARKKRAKEAARPIRNPCKQCVHTQNDTYWIRQEKEATCPAELEANLRASIRLGRVELPL